MKESEKMKGEIQRLRSTVNDMKENSGAFVDHLLKTFAAPFLLPVMAIKSIISAFK